MIFIAISDMEWLCQHMKERYILKDQRVIPLSTGSIAEKNDLGHRQKITS
jgi:hypothetical protein